MNLTRGELSPATITNTITNEVVKFMFNPNEYSITKTNAWNSKNIPGLNLPLLSFGSGGAQSVTLTLHFDTQAQKADVRAYTAPLWKMMMIDESTKSRRSGKGEPPPVTFTWNKLQFKAVITSMTEKMTVFTATGIPVRSTVTISLQQYVDVSEVPPQLIADAKAENERKRQKAIQKTGSDRLDNIAASEGKSPSSYREIAAENNIDNPHNIPTGKTLKISSKR